MRRSERRILVSLFLLVFPLSAHAELRGSLGRALDARGYGVHRGAWELPSPEGTYDYRRYGPPSEYAREVPTVEEMRKMCADAQGTNYGVCRFPPAQLQKAVADFCAAWPSVEGKFTKASQNTIALWDTTKGAVVNHEAATAAGQTLIASEKDAVDTFHALILKYKALYKAYDKYIDTLRVSVNKTDANGFPITDGDYYRCHDRLTSVMDVIYFGMNRVDKERSSTINVLYHAGVPNYYRTQTLK